MQTFIDILRVINTFSPLGVAALSIVTLALVVYISFHRNGPLQSLGSNHLGHVQDALDTIAANSRQQLEVLGDIKADIAYVKGKLDQYRY